MSARAYCHGGAIGEHQGGAERDAGPGIMPAHDRGHVVAAGKQAGDRDRRLRSTLGRRHPCADRRCCRACSDRPPWRSRAHARSGPGMDSDAGADRRCGGRSRSSLCRTLRHRPSRQTDCCSATVCRSPAASTPILRASSSSVAASTRYPLLMNRRRLRRPGGMRPRPYLQMNSRSHTSQAGMVGTFACERCMPIDELVV